MAAAAIRTQNVVELLEAILTYLDYDTLCRCLRVSKHFKTVIENSLTLKEALWLHRKDELKQDTEWSSMSAEHTATTFELHPILQSPSLNLKVINNGIHHKRGIDFILLSNDAIDYKHFIKIPSWFEGTTGVIAPHDPNFDVILAHFGLDICAKCGIDVHPDKVFLGCGKANLEGVISELARLVTTGVEKLMPDADALKEEHIEYGCFSAEEAKEIKPRLALNVCLRIIEGVVRISKEEYERLVAEKEARRLALEAEQQGDTGDGVKAADTAEIADEAKDDEEAEAGAKHCTCC